MVWLIPAIGSPCKYKLEAFWVVTLFCAERVVCPKNEVLQNGMFVDSGEKMSFKMHGDIFKILPYV